MQNCRALGHQASLIFLKPVGEEERCQKQPLQGRAAALYRRAAAPHRPRACAPLPCHFCCSSLSPSFLSASGWRRQRASSISQSQKARAGTPDPPLSACWGGGKEAPIFPFQPDSCPRGAAELAQPFRPAGSPLLRACTSSWGRPQPPLLPGASLLVKHSPGVLARSAWLPAASPPPPLLRARRESLVPAPRAQPGASSAVGDLHCFLLSLSDPKHQTRSREGAPGGPRWPRSRAECHFRERIF